MSELNPIDDIVVVKVGTGVLADTFPDGSQKLNSETFQSIGRSIIDLEENGTNVVLVTSAAIIAGMEVVGETERPDRETEIPELQRLSSIGWRSLLTEWHFALPGMVTSSLQLTKQELNLEAPERSEALRTIHTLLSHNEIPIANENDAITHDEIAFGDNDTLAAILAARIGQSALFGQNIRLVLLSDVEGVYMDKNDPGTLIRRIDNVADYRHIAGDSSSDKGTGGMRTKFDAADIVTEAGLSMRIALGRTDNAIQLALADEIGTLFLPKLVK